MRWLLVSSQHHPSHGGIGAYIARFAAAARSAGWRIELVTRPGDQHPPGAIVHEVSTVDMLDGFAARLPALRRMERVRPYRYALWSRAAAERLTSIDGDFDAIEFVDSQAEGYVALGSRQLRDRFTRSGTPMLIYAHTPMFVLESLNGADRARFGREIYHEWERQSIELADGVMVASALLARKLSRARAIDVVPFPIVADDACFDAESNKRDESILFIGAIQPCKGADVWARSLNAVLRARPRARAMLIGPDTNTAADGTSMIAHVRRLIEPRFAERVHWTGSLPHAEVLKLIRGAALVVVPSAFESFSFVAAESSCAGTPVIASDQVGIVEQIPGMLTFPAGDVRALAEAQIELLSDEQSALRQARQLRSQLLVACDPRKHLQRRAAFVEAIRASSRSSAVESRDSDAMESIDDFISSIEAQERALSCASSAAS